MKTKHIGLLVNSLVSGGAEIQMYLLAKSLQKNTDYKPILIGLTGGGSLELLFQESNIEYVLLNFNLSKFHKSTWFKIRELLKIVKVFRRHKIDTLISRTYYPNVVGNVAGYWAGVKNRYWFQVSVEWNDRNSKIEKLAAKLANKYIANSNDAADYFAQIYKKDRQKVMVLPNMYYKREAKQTTEMWKQQLGVNNQHIVIALLSNFFPVKSHDTAIKAMSILVNKYPNLKLILAGYAPEECNLHKLKALAFDLNLHKNIIFIDSTHDVQGILSLADFCLFTSITKHTEGSPNIILDYMYAKKPIIASNIGPIRELLVNLPENLLYEPENTTDLVNKIEQMIENKKNWQKIGEQNYRNVQEKHSEKKYLDFVLKIINQ